MPVRFPSVLRRVRGGVDEVGALALLVALLVACSSPGEAPPLAPRPGPIDPTATPVPEAPAPGTPLDPHTPGPILPGDAGVPITSTRPMVHVRAEAPAGSSGTPPSTSGAPEQ